MTAQSNTGRQLYRLYKLDPDTLTTNIVIVDGVPYTKLAAFCAAMRRIGWPWRALTIFGYVPQGIGDRAYDWIAKNRFIFGQRDCPLPTAELRGRLIE